MSIRQRANGRWQVRVADGNGQRIERTLPAGATRRDAQALEALLVRRRVETATGRTPRRLIDEAIDAWLPSAQALRSWAKDLKYRVEVLRSHTAGRYLDEIPDVSEALKRKALEAGMSPAGVNRYLAILRRVGNLSFKWGWTDIPYGQRISTVPGERARDVWVAPEQARAIVAACPDPERADAIVFAALTGLRRGEMLALRADQIRDGCIYLDTNTKSAKTRVVPLHPVAAQIAADRLPWQITAVMLRKAFEKARADAGLPHLRLHDMRHAFGSWLDSTGASAGDIRDLLGHSTLAMTSKYVQTPGQQLRDAVARLPDLHRVRIGSGGSVGVPPRRVSNG